MPPPVAPAATGSALLPRLTCPPGDSLTARVWWITRSGLQCDLLPSGAARDGRRAGVVDLPAPAGGRHRPAAVLEHRQAGRIDRSDLGEVEDHGLSGAACAATAASRRRSAGSTSPA